MGVDWLLKNARLQKGGLVDIAIDQGRIMSVVGAGDAGILNHANATWDLNGKVVLPGLVDIHTHLDKTYASIENQSGTLLEAIAMWREIKQQRTAADVAQVTRKAVRQASSHGVTALRTHVDMSVPKDLTFLEAILQVRAEYKTQIDVQIVVLGSASMLEKAPLMREAISMGADFIGGAPALMPNPEEDIRAALDMAELLGVPIDLHIDETEDPNMNTLAYLAEQTITRGLHGQVTAGHCCSLTFMGEETAAKTIDLVAKAQINIVTLPSCNLVLMGREHQPPPRGTTRVKQLLAAGVNVCAGSDNVRDPFNPFGGYDPLHIANLNAHLAHMSSESELFESLAMVTNHAQHAFYVDDAAGVLAAGMPASLTILNTENYLDAVVNPPPRLGTFKDGKLVFKREIQEQWMEE